MRCRCPHCHNPVEIIDKHALTDIECPSCGSNFHLISADSDSATQPYSPRRIANFELLHQVGIGSFGSVWKARDLQLDRIVAVKIPRTETLSESQAAQFFKEARAAAQIQHPNIVSVHEVGRDDNQMYIVSDFVEGANLSQWISRTPLSARESAQLCVLLANALHAAHEAGVVHRDLKPANIMMDIDGNPHIADFGLAKREAGEITVTIDGQILGTPAYMSPEQAKGDGHNADRRSDVYSLGVILYQLITGELPFRGETRMLIVQILQDDPTLPRKLCLGIPKDLQTICLKCLEKLPQNRFQTGKQLAEDLQRFLAGDSILASPPGPVKRSWKWAKKNQTPLLRVAFVGVALVALAFAWLTYVAIKERDSAIKAEASEKIAREAAEAAALELKQSRDDAENERMMALGAAEEATRHLREVARLEKVVERAQQREHDAELEASRYKAVSAKILLDLDSYRDVASTAYSLLIKNHGAEDDNVKAMAKRISELEDASK